MLIYLFEYVELFFLTCALNLHFILMNILCGKESSSVEFVTHEIEIEFLCNPLVL